MSSIEEQIEITRNTLEVLESEKKKRDEELLKNTSIVQVLSLVQSFEKRLELIEKKIEIMSENAKFNNLDDFPQEILGNLSSCFNNLTKNMSQGLARNSLSQININNPPIPYKEVELPNTDSDSDSSIELELELDNAFKSHNRELDEYGSLSNSATSSRSTSPESVLSEDSVSSNDLKKCEVSQGELNERISNLLGIKKTEDNKKNKTEVVGISPSVLQRMSSTIDTLPSSPRLKTNPFILQANNEPKSDEVQSEKLSNSNSSSSETSQELMEEPANNWNFFG